MSKITNLPYTQNSRDFLISSYKERMNAVRAKMNSSSGDIIGHRGLAPMKSRRLVGSEKERVRLTHLLKNRNHGDIIGHRDNMTRKIEYDMRRAKLRNNQASRASATSGDIIQHRDTTSVLGRNRPRSARKVRRPTYDRMFKNGDIVCHKDDSKYRTKQVFGKRPMSARKSRFTGNSGDIVYLRDNKKYAVSYRVGKKIVDSPKYLKRNGGKRVGYRSMDSKLKGVVPRNGFKKYQRSPRKVHTRKQ